MASQSTTIGAIAVGETHVFIAVPSEPREDVVVNTSDGLMLGYVGTTLPEGDAPNAWYVNVRSSDGAWYAPAIGLTREHALIRLGILIAERYAAQGGTA